MPIRTSYDPGTFSWVELETADAPAAKKFYSGLFGWSYDDRPAGPGMTYTMCKIGDAHVAALYQQSEQKKGVPSHWDSYVTVSDVDATAKTATENGGTVLKEPFDVMDVGRMAVIRDPAGAVFCLWQARKHIGAELEKEQGTLCWNELYTDDIDRAAKFYAQTLGWVAQPVDMGPMGTYVLFKSKPTDESNKAGMMQLTAQMKGVPPHWLPYFAVMNCDESTQTATSLGAKLLMPPTDIPDIGRFSVVADPQGAAFALYTNAH